MKYLTKLPLLSIMCLVLALSACGGNSNKSASVPKDPVEVVVQPTILDTFTKFVIGLLGSAPEDSEPISIANINVTMPEDTEPVLVPL